MILTLSLCLNAVLLGALAYLVAFDPVVATVTTPTGVARTVMAGVVNRELAERHGEEVQSDLVGRALIDLAAEESHIEFDHEEFEERWQDWLAEPGTQARLDSGEVTQSSLQDRLMTLVLLDQLSWNELTRKEQEAVTLELFEAQQRNFEQLHLRHIMLESQKDALDVAARLAAGVDFSELAKRFSLDPLTREQGGDMGWKRRADLTEDLRAFLFLLPTGTASAPVASRTGWHIFLVEERRESFEECRPLVRREAMRQMRAQTLDNLRERFKVERSENGDLLRKLQRPGHLQSAQEKAFRSPAGTRPTQASSPLNKTESLSPTPSPEFLESTPNLEASSEKTPAASSVISPSSTP